MEAYFTDILHSLQEFPLIFTLGCGVLGLCIGSFLNVVIYRLPVMMEKNWREECTSFLHPEQESEQQSESEPPPRFNLMTPRSACPNCQHAIASWENIPVISWLFLRGRCSGCKKVISPRYPLVEITTAILFTIVAAHFGVTIAAVAACLFTATLIALTMIDYDHMLLPDSLVLPLVWAGLIVNYFSVFTDFSSAFWGAVWGYLILWSIFWLFKLATGKDGMGYGDFKLLAALGAWGGYELLPAIIVLSSIAGVVIGAGLIVLQKLGKGKPMPFGPYLAIAGWIALLWGAELTQTWLSQYSYF